MLRTAKSDDPVACRHSEDESADDESMPEGSGSVIASSALRWLRGAKTTQEASVGPASPSDLDAAAEDADDQADDLGPIEPLGLIESEHDDEDDEFEPSMDLDSTGAGNDKAVSPTASRVVKASYVLDDDDDIGDFDDLDLSSPPAPAEDVYFLPDINLDDIRLPRDSRLDPPADVADIEDLVEADVEVVAIDDAARLTDGGGEPELPDAPIGIDDPAIEVHATEALPAPLRGLPSIATEAQEMQRRKAELLNVEAPSKTLDEAPERPIEASLALQPIPELQTELREPSTTSSASANRDDHLYGSLDHGEPASEGFRATVPDLDDDADLDLQPLNANVDEIEALTIESLDSTMSDATDDIIADNIGNDWHAHLANVLGDEGGTADSKPLECEPDASLPTGTAGRTSDRDEDASSVLPLSKSLVLSPVEDEDDGDSLGLPPSFLAGTRHKGQFTHPADTAELSQEQLSLGIIANVPRLRRFAAAQIGDESLADELVQTTIETALGDSSVLEPNVDLGLALLTLLSQRRREMLCKPMTPEPSLDSERAFESALCQGLAGADQFEINQFARAINELDERSRALLVLVALENLTYYQIAGIVQISVEEVICDVAKARMKLRQVLASDELGVPGEPRAYDGPHAQEIEIHGYLDGELDGRHMADIDALIECDEDAANRLLQYGIQGDLIRRLYTPLLNRPIPGGMLKSLAQATKPTRWSFRLGTRRALIASAAVFVLASSVIWPFAAPALSGVISDAVAISLATIQG